jgi:hypothetical protein
MKKQVNNALKPDLHPKFFWDTNVDKLNWVKAYRAVIARIIERGSEDELAEIVRFYGRTKVLKLFGKKFPFCPIMPLMMPSDSFPNLKSKKCTAT